MMFFWRNKQVTVEHIRELTKIVVRLREDIDDLSDKHERLRGKFYALRPKSTAPDDDPGNSDASASSDTAPRRAKPNRAESKSEILARYFTPGRPTVHNTGG